MKGRNFSFLRTDLPLEYQYSLVFFGEVVEEALLIVFQELYLFEKHSEYS